MSSDQKETIQFYAQNPPNNFVLTDPTISYSESNRICGDDIEVFLKIEDNTITDWSFSGNTALITTACSAIFGELVVGMSFNDVFALNRDKLIELTQIEVSYRRRRAQVIALLATRNALHKYLQDGKRDDFSDVGIEG